jgi:hypothetical protein
MKTKSTASQGHPRGGRLPLRRLFVIGTLLVVGGLSAVLANGLLHQQEGEHAGDTQPASETSGLPSAPIQQQTSKAPPKPDPAVAGQPSTPQSSEPLPVRTEEAVAALPSSLARRTNLKDDPHADGWDSEVQGERASVQLKAIGELLSHPEQLDAAHAGKIATDDFSCGRLRPVKLREVFKDKSLTVLRPAQADASAEGGRHGVLELVNALKELAAPFGDTAHLHVKFKVFRVEKSDTSVATVAYFEAGGTTRIGSLEVHSTWTCRWVPGPAETLRLEFIGIHDYEESVLHSADKAMFADCTEAVLGHNDCFKKQLMHGTEHWRRRLETTLGMNSFGHEGIAVGDVNGDGLEDVFVCGSGGLPCRLFIQNPDGTATDRAAWAGVDWLDGARGALFVDLDNDGDQDLVISTQEGLVFMENDGTGRFTLRIVLRNLPEMYSLAAADYDNDGFLDIYVCNYNVLDVDELNIDRWPRPLPYYDANNGGRNHLLKNDGHWHFKDVTKEVGLDVNNHRWSFAASWDDFDNDGLLDLYVANDFGRKNLYKNMGGRFVDVAGEAGVEDMGSGMSVSWGDYNRDGWMDLYVANMFSSAGGRITFQPQFKPGVSPGIKANIQRLAKGNSLFRNSRNGKFEDVGFEAGVEMGRWSWSSNFVDLDNDGWEDLVVMNGYITNEDPADL